MPAVPVKKMLEKILKTATLSAKDREIFEGMWDAAHRYGLSRKQTAWIEDVYYKQDLEKPGRPPPKRTPKTGFINADVQTVKKARNLAHFLELHPEASEQMKARAKAFFESGGEVLEIRPQGVKKTP